MTSKIISSNDKILMYLEKENYNVTPKYVKKLIDLYFTDLNIFHKNNLMSNNITEPMNKYEIATIKAISNMDNDDNCEMIKVLMRVTLSNHINYTFIKKLKFIFEFLKSVCGNDLYKKYKELYINITKDKIIYHESVRKLFPNEFIDFKEYIPALKYMFDNVDIEIDLIINEYVKELKKRGAFNLNDFLILMNKFKFKKSETFRFLI